MSLKEFIEFAPKHIVESFIFKSYKRGDHIILPDIENNYLYILTRGSAEVYRGNHSGSMISLHIYEACSFFGELEIFNSEIKTLGVIAKSNCETIIIHKENVYKWMKADFDFTFYIVEELAKRLVLSSDTVTKLSLLTVKDRILSSIHAHYKIGDLDSLTKQKLSGEVCVPIRSLNRSIAQCINDGFIDYVDKRFSVISIAKLEEYTDKFLS